jgi:hypothetical protein
MSTATTFVVLALAVLSIGAGTALAALHPPDAPMSQSKLRAKLEAPPAIHQVRVRTYRVTGSAVMPLTWGYQNTGPTLPRR